MRINIRFFASLVEQTGIATETLEIESSASIEALWQALVDRHPALADLSYRPLVACDLQYSAWDRSVDGVSEVAFLPPVSGG
jgi:molybdopterin converting factor subunit 1